MQEIARDVAVLPISFVNVYLVGNSDSWVLVDTGLPGSELKIKGAAEARFGSGARPRAIVLTHGHFDHAGSALGLAELWDVKVFAHQLEKPFLTGVFPYPPLDPTAPGAFSFLSRFISAPMISVDDRYSRLPDQLAALGMDGWEWVFTSGHSPGHVSLFRSGDSTLLAGDAVTTLDMDTPHGLIGKRAKICRPPVPGTIDWYSARQSVRSLAKLRPRVIGAGHGHPMFRCADDLQKLADSFPIPEHGRYVEDPVQTDENGTTYLPAKPFDPVPSLAAGLAIGILVAGVAAVVPGKHKSWD